MNRIALPLLTLGLSFAPVLCWAAERNSDQAKAVAEIEKVGGKVTFDEKSPGRPVISVDFTNTQVTDSALAHLERLTQLRDLSLWYTNVTDAGLEHIKDLTKRQSLNLWGTKVTDIGIEHLKGLTQLKDL